LGSDDLNAQEGSVIIWQSKPSDFFDEAL